jgi:hypothetical protein
VVWGRERWAVWFLWKEESGESGVAGEVGEIKGVAGEGVCCAGRVSSGTPVCPLLPLFNESSYGVYLSDTLFSTHISPPSTIENKRCRPIGTSSIAMCTNTISHKWELLFLSWSARSLLLQHIYANIQDIKMDEAIRLESSRMENKLWTPIRTLKLWWPWDMSEHGQQDELDDNPSLYIIYPSSFMLTNGRDVVDIVQGAQPMHGDLGIARRRDPDALPPRNVLEWCLNYVYLFLTRKGGNLLYAVKAGLFTGAPYYFCVALRVPDAGGSYTLSSVIFAVVCDFCFQ